MSTSGDLTDLLGGRAGGLALLRQLDLAGGALRLREDIGVDTVGDGAAELVGREGGHLHLVLGLGELKVGSDYIAHKRTRKTDLLDGAARNAGAGIGRVRDDAFLQASGVW